jgi:hypothetical protein
MRIQPMRKFCLYRCNGDKKILENTYLKLDANRKVKSARRGPYWRLTEKKLLERRERL